MNDDYEANEADEDFETWEFLADEAFKRVEDQPSQKDDDSPEALEPIPA